jgi:hypothetical protein
VARKTELEKCFGCGGEVSAEDNYVDTLGGAVVHNGLRCLRLAVEGARVALHCSVCGDPIMPDTEVRRLPDTDSLIHDTVECLTKYLTEE